MSKQTFEAWMKAVDVEIEVVCGLSSGDLADTTWWDFWNDDMSARDAAHDHLLAEGFPEDCL